MKNKQIILTFLSCCIFSITQTAQFTIITGGKSKPKQNDYPICIAPQVVQKSQNFCPLQSNPCTYGPGLMYNPQCFKAPKPQSDTCATCILATFCCCAMFHVSSQPTELHKRKYRTDGPWASKKDL